ncbi:MAG: DUF1549 domain-containing protein, partial [Planctomycetaceae bacterium]
MPSVSLGRVACLAVLALVSLAAFAAGAEPVDFRKQIQPILAEHCTLCHGADVNERRGGLRLDLKETAFEGGDSGEPAIVAGQPTASELIRRITSTDPGEVMPPPSQKNALTPAQVELLRRWVEQGAEYRGHWAFESVEKPPVPEGGLHPIDAFVRSGLRERGLEPSPVADNATLCRRLYLDVIGLPPTPEELEEFERDGLGATLKKLLASERYGEKWARHWLDAARYSDTNGYEKDLAREQWIWRDWVVRALNTDMPYDQFLIEQIAGDLLPSATQDQIIATGFLRNSMINEEGAIIPEEFRMVEMFDRMDCIGKAVLGLTTQCAQCHSHKFDPLTQEEYFGMFAFLNDTHEARSYVYTPEQLADIAAMRAEIAAAEAEIRRQRPQWQVEMDAWAAEVAAAMPAWTAVTMKEMHSLGLLTHPTQRPDGSILMIGHRDSELFFDSEPDLTGATGLQLEALTDGDLFMQGPGRDGNWAIARMRVQVKRPDAKDWEDVKLVNASADFSEPERVVPLLEPDPKQEGEAAQTTTIGHVGLLIDEHDSSAWSADRGPLLRHQPAVAVVQFEQPLDMPAGTRLRIALKWSGKQRHGRDHTMLGCCRFSLTKDASPAAPPIDHGAILAARTPRTERTDAERAALFAAWRKTIADLAEVNERIAAAWEKAPTAPTTVLHAAPRSAAQHRTTYLLDRGTWNQPKHEVQPHVPAGLHPFVASGDPPRLAFAKWLVDPRSPLTARVAVNRIWQAIFGQGLVETPDDFGTRAPVPEYR